MEEAQETYSYAVTGNYSVVYTAKDKTGNTASTSTYYINVVEDYADETEPTVTVNNAPERVVVKKGATFTVPAATFYSKEDSNLTTSLHSDLRRKIHRCQERRSARLHRYQNRRTRSNRRNRYPYRNR